MKESDSVMNFSFQTKLAEKIKTFNEVDFSQVTNN